LGRLRDPGRLALNARRSPADAATLRRRFDTLLARLASNGDGALDYERLRRRLLLYFQVQAPADAEAAADETLDRLARRMDDGTAIDNVPLFALGIARNLLRELRARGRRADAAVQMLAASADDTDSEDADRGAELDALRACLQGLESSGARLILDYYSADGADRIRVRRDLAQRLALGLNALRNRALRLRGALEACLRRRLGHDAVPDVTDR